MTNQNQLLLAIAATQLPILILNSAVILCKGPCAIHTAHLQKWERWLCEADENPLPVIEHVLCSFVSHLAQQVLKHHFIKIYWLAVPYLQIEIYYPDLFGRVVMLKLDYVLQGERKHKERRVGQLHHSRHLHRFKSQWEHTWDSVLQVTIKQRQTCFGGRVSTLAGWVWTRGGRT